MSDIDWRLFWSNAANRARNAHDIAAELGVGEHVVRCSASRHRVSLLAIYASVRVQEVVYWRLQNGDTFEQAAGTLCSRETARRIWRGRNLAPYAAAGDRPSRALYNTRSPTAADALGIDQPPPLARRVEHRSASGTLLG